MPRWQANGWRTSDKKPVKNRDLWERLGGRARESRRALALGARPCRPRRERARRRARARSGAEDQGNHCIGKVRLKSMRAQLPPPCESWCQPQASVTAPRDHDRKIGECMRQVVLDTETTGLEVQRGHRLIEIGCVELAERRPTGRTFHVYLNPERAIDEGARAVTGISDEFLLDKPRFAEVVARIPRIHRRRRNHRAQRGVRRRLHRRRARPRRRRARPARRSRDRARYARARAREIPRPAQQPRRAVPPPRRRQQPPRVARRAARRAAARRGLSRDDGGAGLARLRRGSGRAGRARCRDGACRSPCGRACCARSPIEIAAHAARLEAIDKASKGACLWKQLAVETQSRREAESST